MDGYHRERDPDSLSVTSMSRVSRSSIRSRTSLMSDQYPSTGSDPRGARGTGHRRNRSDTSGISQYSHASYTGSEVVAPEEHAREPTLFVDAPPKNLKCMICDNVFTDPVIAKCGHTFCRRCVMNMPPGEKCPLHQTALSRNVIPNLSVVEQIAELHIYCKHGLKAVPDRVGTFTRDPDGCTHTMKLGERVEHEEQCLFEPTVCTNSDECGAILRRDLEQHLAECPRTKCPQSFRGCTFTATKAEVDQHVKECKFEDVKGAFEHSDRRITTLQEGMAAKDEEIEFLRTMLVKLSAKVERMEGMLLERIDHLDTNFDRFRGGLQDLARTGEQNSRELSSIQAKLGLVDDISVISQSHTFKCQGTFVGHQGPVWALAAHGDLLFSGSSDETIKVWDTARSFTCKHTLREHRGIIHTLIIVNHKLFSGSSDSTIKVWDIDNFELIHTIEAGHDPVCTLAFANGMLFSGSLKVIKIWDIHTLQQIGELAGLNHWVRALVATADYLYAGSYQTVSIWSSRAEDLAASCTDVEDEPSHLHVLHTSGGSVYSICVTQDYIICGTYENLIHVWDHETYEDAHTLQGHIGTVYALCAISSSDRTGKGGRLFSASYDKTVRVWSLDNFNCVQTLTRHANSVDCLCVQHTGAHGARLFSGAADSTVKVWQ